MVVPVRGWPTITMGRSTAPRATSGWSRRQADDAQAVHQVGGQVPRRHLHADVVEPGLVGQRGRPAAPGPPASVSAPKSSVPATATASATSRSTSKRLAVHQPASPAVGTTRVDQRRRRRVVEPAHHHEAPVAPARVEPVGDARVVGGHRRPAPARRRSATAAGVGQRAAPAAGVDALVPDVLDGDAPVAGVGRLQVEDQGLVGLEAERAEHVEVVGRGVGRAQVGGLGRHQLVRHGQQLGLDRLVQGGELGDRPGHGGELGAHAGRRWAGRVARAGRGARSTARPAPRRRGRPRTRAPRWPTRRRGSAPRAPRPAPGRWAGRATGRTRTSRRRPTAGRGPTRRRAMRRGVSPTPASTWKPR